MWGAWVFCLGLFLASFIHTTAERLSFEQSLLTPSSCNGCGRNLKVYELIPVVNWLMLRGKSSCCKEPIPKFYPAFELGFGLLALLFYQEPQAPEGLVLELLFIAAIILIALVDFKTLNIYTTPVVAALLFQAVRLKLLNLSFEPYLIGLLAGAGLFHFVALFFEWIRKKAGLGTGDASLLGVLGFWLGFPALLPVIFWSAFLGVVIGGGGSLLMKRSLKEPIPFGPFLVVGAILVRLFPNYFFYPFEGFS